MLKLKNILLESDLDEFDLKQIYKITVSPEFKSWFGNSKVVDKLGYPRIVYHGGTVEDKFDSSFISKTSGMRDYGFAFTTNQEIAKMYAKYSKGKLNAYFLKIPKLAKYDAEHKFAHDARWKFAGKSWNMFDIQEFHKYGKAIQPYTETAKPYTFEKTDGVLFENIYEEDSKNELGDTYIVFNPDSIWKIEY